MREHKGPRHRRYEGAQGSKAWGYEGVSGGTGDLN